MVLTMLSKAARDQRAAERCGCNECCPRPAPGACRDGMHHEGEIVTSLAGETVGYVCRHCMVRLIAMRTPGSDVVTHWWPYDDNGRPLATLPSPRACIRPRAHR